MVLGVVSLAVAACGGGGGEGEGSVGGPAPRAPQADARAGRPALLALVRDRAVLLDAAGRVARALPEDWGEFVRVCPGGRRLVAAPDFGGFVEARTVGGRRLWRTRMPAAAVQRVGCLDERARRVAVVRGIDRVKSLRIVTRHSHRGVRRFAGEVLRLEPRRMYWRDDDRLNVDSLPSGRRLESYTAPKEVYSVSRSPDGLHLALWAWNDPLSAPVLEYLLDTTTGAVRAIEDAELDLLGWRADGLLIARTPTELVALDSALQVRERMPGVRAQQVLITGSRILTLNGRALSTVTSDGQRRIGTVPAQTRLLAAL